MSVTNSVTKLVSLDDLLLKESGEYLHDDFFYLNTSKWLETGATGTIAAGGHSQGHTYLVLTTGNSAGNKEGFKSALNNFLPLANNSMACVCKVNLPSHSANSEAFGFGFVSTDPQNATSTVVPSASYSGAIIYRLSGESVWRVQSSNGSVKSDNISLTSVREGIDEENQNRLSISITGFDGLNALVTYQVNNEILLDSVTRLPISHKLAYLSLTSCYLWGQAQASGSNVEVANVDLAVGYKARF